LTDGKASLPVSAKSSGNVSTTTTKGQSGQKRKSSQTEAIQPARVEEDAGAPTKKKKTDNTVAPAAKKITESNVPMSQPVPKKPMPKGADNGTDRAAGILESFATPVSTRVNAAKSSQQVIQGKPQAERLRRTGISCLDSD
jgi:flagellar hook-length control protein FliK